MQPRTRTIFVLALLGAAACGNATHRDPDGGKLDPTDAAASTDGPAGDAGADSGIPIPAGSIVSGAVVDAIGVPQGQVTVEIAGQLVVTGSDGRFSVQAPAAFPFDVRVSSRYDVSAVLPPQPPRRIGALFVGVERLDPTLMLPFEGRKASGPRAMGQINGGLAGLGRPSDATSGIVISPLGIGNAGVTTYSALTGWALVSPTDTSRSTAVRIAYWKGMGETISFLAMGKSADQTINNGQTVTNVNITTAAASSAPLSASLTASSTFTSLKSLVSIGLGDFTFTPWEANKPLAGATTISMPVPQLDEASYDLSLLARVSADDTSGRQVHLVARKLAPGADLGAVALPDPPALAEPGDAAIVPLSGTAFRLTQAESHVRVYAFDYDDVGVFVISAAEQIAFPDLSPVSITTPTSGTAVGWRVTSYAEASVAAALGPRGYTGASADRTSIPAGEVRIEGSSERRTLMVQ
ncbi:MAG: hypothetical protein ABI321_11215 [Polyangia bacterium]